jgi:hypothetical protein
MIVLTRQAPAIFGRGFLIDGPFFKSRPIQRNGPTDGSCLAHQQRPSRSVMKSRRLTQRSRVTIYYRRSDLVRHSKAWLRMSALGQKQTWRLQFAMSALPPKADIRPRDQDVRFGPEADSCTAAIGHLDNMSLHKGAKSGDRFAHD